MTDHPGGAGITAWLRARIVLLILLSLMLAGVVVLSFQFNYAFDTAQMLWYGRLLGEQHIVPYRDLFEENLPGAILAYTAIGAFIDYSSRFMLRVFDLFYLTAIGLATWRWLKPLGRHVAWAAIVLFAIFYLLGGPGFSTQREYVFLLPVVVGVAVSTSTARMLDTRRALIVGLLFGIATTIKPHAAIGILPLCVFHYFEIRARQGGVRPSLGLVVRVLLAYALGGLIPILAVIGWLAVIGGLGPWLTIITEYWPLYATHSGNITVLTGLARLGFIAESLVGFGGQAPWLIPAAAGAVIALWPGNLTASMRRRVWLGIALPAVYILYPALTGQFYPQHWLPMTFFLLAASGLCFVRPPATARWLAAAAPLAAVLIALVLRGEVLAGGVSQMVDSFVYHRPLPSIDGDRGAEIAGYLEANMHPGDTVQSLDPVGYAMHGMLLAGAKPASRFQADAPFYTQPDSPYIKGLRAELIGALTNGKPRYVIDVVARARLRSGNDIPPFTELDDMLHTDYSPAYLGHGFIIYERVEGARPGLVVYPAENSGASTTDLAPLKDDLITFASGRPAANPDGVGRRLEAFVAVHDVIEYENLGEDSDSARLLEVWLNGAAYRVSRAGYASTQQTTYINPGTACPPPDPLNYAFEDKFVVTGAGMAPIEVNGQRYLCVRLQLDAPHLPDLPYVFFVHLDDAGGKSVVQYDSQPVQNLAVTGWGEEPIEARLALPLPAGLVAGDYTARLYFYEIVTSRNLALPDGLIAAPLGTIHLP